MAATSPYLAAKAHEYTTILDWTDRHVASLVQRDGPQRPVIAAIRDRLAEAQSRLRRLQTITTSGLPRLAPRGLTIVHEIEFDVLVLGHYYIPGLLVEGDRERSFGALVVAMAHRCGLGSIEDIVLRLDDGHAAFVGFPDCPVIWAPPYQVETLLDFPALYHELGHVAFNWVPPIADALSATIDRYYQHARQRPGLLGPDQRVDRERWINTAKAYWSEARLDELFSDAFAAFVCGPAYYYSCVDLAMRFPDDPYHVDFGDEHPPSAARVRACLAALLPMHAGDPSCRAIGELWASHVAGRASSGDYRWYCNDALIDELTRVSIESIENHLPAARRYDLPLPSANRVPRVGVDTRLEDALNWGTVLLLGDPAAFPRWERDAVTALLA